MPFGSAYPWRIADLPLDLRSFSVKLIIQLLSEHLLCTSFNQFNLDPHRFETDQHLSFGIFHDCFCEMLPLMFDYDISLAKELLDILYEASELDPVGNLRLIEIVRTERPYLPVRAVISRGCIETLFKITEAQSPLFLANDHGN
jgi:hypothetical protein